MKIKTFHWLNSRAMNRNGREFHLLASKGLISGPKRLRKNVAIVSPPYKGEEVGLRRRLQALAFPSWGTMGESLFTPF